MSITGIIVLCACAFAANAAIAFFGLVAMIPGGFSAVRGVLTGRIRL